MQYKREKTLYLLFFFLILAFCLQANDTLKIEKIYNEGKDAYYDGAYLKARGLFEEALLTAEALYGPEHKEVIRILLRMTRNERRYRAHQEALKLIDNGLALAQKVLGANHETVGDFYMEKGQVYSQMYRPRKANEYFQKSLEIFQQVFGEVSSEVGNIYMDFGMSFTKMTNYYDANLYFQRAFEVFQKSSKPTSKDFYRIYNNWGYCFRKMGDYEKGLDFAKKALEIKLLHYDPDHASVAKYHRNIAKNLEGLGQYEAALPYMQEALRIAEQASGADHANTGGAYGELANIYADLGQSVKALSLYQKGIAILEKKLRPTHPYLVGGYYNIGRVYEDMEAYDEALAFYEIALSKFEDSPYVPKNLIAETQGQIAYVLFEKGAQEDAIKTIDLAISSLSPELDLNSSGKQHMANLDKIQTDVELLDLLALKSRLLSRKFDNQALEDDLLKGYNNSLLAIQLVEKMRRGYQSENARQYLNTETASIYELAIDQAFELHQLSSSEVYLSDAFELAEKSRSNILWQNLNHQDALTAAGIPLTKLGEIEQLKENLAHLEEELYGTEVVEKRKSLESEIFDKKLQFETLIASLEADNPDYYRIKYASTELDVATLKQQLPDDRSALIEYHYTDRFLYTFILSKTNFKGFRQDLPQGLTNKILTLHEPFDPSYSADKSQETYLNTLHEFYNLLIEPLDLNPSELSRLVLVPHGILQLLPFEALCLEKEDADFRNLDYLIKDYELQYAWSAALWAKNYQKSSRKEYPYVGFAPEFGQNQIAAAGTYYRNQLIPLPYAIAEAESGERFFNGNLFLGMRASEQHFLETAPKSRIIHLATHAFTNDQYPLRSGLVFEASRDSIEDGFLNAYEIYNLQLDADLAVISACNTGLGKVQEGEGVMSLGRAFLYAGCRSVMMSLWLANDVATSQIVQDFYQYAAEGQTKSAAVRQAKLDYLAEADALTAHPHFWANLVMVGDVKPLKSKPGNWWWIGIIGMLGFIWFLFNRRKVKEREKY